FGRNGGRPTNAHRMIHTTPNAPVMMNASCQPTHKASGPPIRAAPTPPSVPPLNDIAIARALRVAGSDSTAVRNPPGNVTPSPKPRKTRPAAKPITVVIQPCDTLAAVQIATPNSIPLRRPT